MRRLLGLLALILLLSPAVIASGGEASHEPALRGREIFWKAFNIAILAGLLVRFLGKPIADHFRSRRAEIAEELAEARRARDEALARLQEIEAKLEKADAEAAAMMRRAEEEAQAERDRILKDAGLEEERIRQVAREEIRRSVDIARAELRAYAAELATTRAASILEAELQEADHRRILAEYLRKLGQGLPS